MARGAGVVDEDVEAAEVTDRLVDHAQDLGFAGYVGLDRQRLGAERADFLRGRLGVRPGARVVDDDPFGAGTRQVQRNGSADAGAAARDERHRAFQLHLTRKDRRGPPSRSRRSVRAGSGRGRKN